MGIMSDYVSALDKNWHSEHLKCCQCSQQIQGDKGEVCEKNGEPCCTACISGQKTKDKCAGCKECVEGGTVELLDQTWHLKCLLCYSCKTDFSDKLRVFSFDSKPWCSTCSEDMALQEDEAKIWILQ